MANSHTPRSCRFWFRFFILTSVLIVSSPTFAQENLSPKGKELYDQIKAFTLSGGSVEVHGLSLTRDRVNISFDGTFYFTSPLEGHVTGAVFLGQGKISAEVPPSDFEKDNVKRLLGTSSFESDFKTAVLRFTDDTFDVIGKNIKAGATSDERAQKLGTDVEARILKETGANLSARLTLSILNAESPGFFFANFDGGKRGRFSYVLDHQNRLPVANFDLNGGEKGLIFSYQSIGYFNEIWMAFYGLEDYQRGSVPYSDVNDLVDISHYDMDLDLRDPKKKLRLLARIDAKARFPNLRAVPFNIGESLSEFESWRLKKQLRVKQARLGGTELATVQEDWEGGLTVFLPGPTVAGQKVSLELILEGDFMYNTEPVPDCHYPRSNTSWFPRHGYLDRATFELTYHHSKKLKVASVGKQRSEEPDPEDKDSVVSKYSMEHPVALVTFALGPFERHRQTVKWEKGWEPIPVEFNSLRGIQMAIKEDFIVAELDNSIRYFSVLFGKYPYPIFGAAFHPFGFGQGFPSLLMIPPTDRDSKYTYVFIAHETAHQWWGNIVAWRSYRDQWLSEGFAEYSGILYTGKREGKGTQDDLLGELRSSLKNHPTTTTGVGSSRLVDVGPIILGHRLNTSKTLGAYQTLIYNKGALVLRMLHFLLTDPATGDGQAFFNMMTDFVERHRDQFASTDDFRVVANEHFAKSPIGRKYKLDNLDWFFKQWVHQSGMPAYRMNYRIEDQPDGKFLLTGTITQEKVPADWFMVLPVVISFGDKREARGTVHAYGPSTTFQIRLPMRPKKVELDPDDWIISESTSTSGG